MNQQWMNWLRTYVVQTLTASPIKRNLVRTYVTHVYNVFQKDLRCENINDILGLVRSDVVRAIVNANPHCLHQQHLCRNRAHLYGTGARLHRSQPLPEQCPVAGLCTVGAPPVCANEGPATQTRNPHRATSRRIHGPHGRTMARCIWHHHVRVVYGITSRRQKFNLYLGFHCPSGTRTTGHCFLRSTP